MSPQSLLSTGRGVGVGESSTAQQSVEEFRARQARTRLYYTACESSVASFQGKGVGLGEESTFRREHALLRERALLRKGARPFNERGAPFWERHVHLDLVAEEGAPFLKRARPF